ncbi:MAG: LacI family DNA-binding transcriptional regulator [Faecousia sp.]
MDKKVRMADIAQRLGISIVSVSKGLAGKDGVSEEMRSRILQTAEEMGYRLPRTKKEEAAGSGNIGILVADRFVADNAFYPALYRHVMVRCSEGGYSAIMEIVSPEAEAHCVLPAIIQGSKVEGIIFMGELRRNYLKTVIASGLPYIFLDFYDEELEADSVTSDNIVGGFRVTNALLQTGRREIAYVGSILATSSIMDRYLGYTKALMRAGIPIRPEWRLEDRDVEGKFVEVELPARMPQAFVCNCDEVAMNLVEKLKSRGYRVPEDVAVTGYDDHQFAQICNPPLTSYRVNVEEMGRAAAAQLLRKVKGKRITSGNTVVGGELILRQSI